MVKISDMTIAQLRRALRDRGLNAEGLKADLEIRLRADLEEDPDHLNKDEYEYEDAVSGELKLLLSAQSEQFNSRIENIAAQLLEQVNSRITAQSEQITAESEKVNSRITAQSEQITAESEKLKSNIKEDINILCEKLSNDIGELTNRVGKLEQDELEIKREIKEVQSKFEKFDKDIHSELEIKHKEIYSEIEKNRNESNKQLLDVKNKLDKRISNLESLGGLPPQTGACVLVDPKVIRDSLPEYSGRLEEDPNKFLLDSVALLQRTNLPINIYVHILSQQLKGQAAAWWQNIKSLGLDFEDFKKELSLRFDSDGVRTAVNRKFLTESQPTGMRAGAFVIQKYQLYKRLHPEGDSSSALPNIIELLNDKIRPLVRVANPGSFKELREVIRKLEEEYKPRNPPGDSQTPSPKKCYKCGAMGHVRDRCPEN